jgi:hypothetical protein
MSNPEIVLPSLDKDSECQRESNEKGRRDLTFTCIVAALNYNKREVKATKPSGGTTGHQILIE